MEAYLIHQITGGLKARGCKSVLLPSCHLLPPGLRRQIAVAYEGAWRQSPRIGMFPVGAVLQNAITSG